MRRATITIPDDVDERVERFAESQPAPPSLTSVVQAALRRFLDDPTTTSGAEPAINRVLRNRAEINRIVAEHGGSNARLFGSVARGEAGPASDIDLLVTMGPNRSLFDLARMRVDLEQLLECEVDVVTNGGLEGESKRHIEHEALAL